MQSVELEEMDMTAVILTEVTCSESIETAESLQNDSSADPAHEEQNKNPLSAAVRGFVVSSDRDLLLSKQKHVTKRYQCYICDETFAIARVYETHKILEHNVPAPWKCSECGMQFLHGTLYNLHMVGSHQAKAYVCGIESCPAVFHCKLKLTAHKIECHGHKNYGKEKMVLNCQYCGKEYTQQSKLKYHVRKHTGEKPYKCIHCSRTFRTSSQRTMHIKSAHNHQIRSHLCDWCGKKFFSANQLRSHVLTHTGERPYPCPLCPRSFSKTNTRHVHMRQHTGEKPYVCDQCGQSFTVHVSLRTHLKTKHNIVVDAAKKIQREETQDGTVPSLGRPRLKDVPKTDQILKDRRGEVVKTENQIPE